MAPTPQPPKAERALVDKSTIGDVKLGLKVDTKALDGVSKSLKGIRTEVDLLKKAMDNLSTSAGKAQSAMAGVGGSSSKPSSSGNLANIGVGLNSAGTSPLAKSGGLAPSQTSGAVMLSSLPGGIGGGGGGAGLGGLGAAAGGTPQGMAAMAAAQLAKPIMDAVIGAIDGAFNKLDARIEQGRQYAAGASRTNLLLQQASGRQESGRGSVIDAYRKPLIPYKLGMGGIDDVLQFRMAYGMDMDQSSIASMGRSVEALRVSSGFTRSTQDILNSQQALMRPETVNRMFYMLGTSAYGVGGTETDPLQMRQQIIQRMGLTSKSQISSALKLGSVARARMADAGVTDEAEQTAILEYARQNVAFGESGGQGFYDPSSKEHRKLLGDAEGNFALQQEETSRQQVRREEEFMSRQIDDMANTEKYQQKVIELLTSMDTALQYAYKMRQGYAGAVTSTLKGIATAPMRLFSSALGALGLGDPIGSSESGGSGGTGGVSSGAGNSGSGKDSTTTIPYGYQGGTITLDQLKSKPSFASLHRNMQNRLLNMFRANPAVGFGGGTRNESEQRDMFLKRYRRTDAEYNANGDKNIFWDGSYWEHHSGLAAAPPGRSMHEIGLAADLVGDIGWVVDHAQQFGLQHFLDVNNEPHHVQPAELPRSRFEYEKQGAVWGTDGAYDATDLPGNAESAFHGNTNVGGIGFIDTKNQSISDMLKALSAAGTAQLMAGGTGATSFVSGSSSSSSSGFSIRNRQLTGEEVARLAYNAGFRGQDLVNVVAISQRESGWQTGAYNPNRDTRDDSFGLMQINMLGDLEQYRLDLFGISSKEQLFDPQTNMNAAFKLYQMRNNSLYDWGEYKGESNTYNTDLASARTAVQNAGLMNNGGDPIGSSAPSRGSRQSGSKGSSVVYNSAPTINVAPNISFNGVPERADLHEIARTVTKILRDELARNEMRTA